VFRGYTRFTTVLTVKYSSVTMGWLLHLVTGGPTGRRGPPTVLEFLVINFSVCLVLLKLKNANRHNQELAKS